MTNDQILAVVEKYRAKLQMPASYTVAKRADENSNEHTGQTTYNHVLWMLGEIPELLATYKREKAMRWLGFVQGVLWSMGIYSIVDLKEDNR